jgi:hypothetical protein
MAALSELTLGEIGRGLARYRPVALTVAAILVAIVVLPRPDSASDQAVPLDGAGRAGTVVTVPAGGSAGDAGSTDPTAASADPDTSFTGPSSSSSFTTSPSSSSSFGSGSSGDADFSASPTTTALEGDFTFAPTTSSDQPLRVVAKAWASRTAGTPLAANGVTPGTLPVGVRAGQDDKLSFVRLSGDEDILRLSEDPAGAREVQGPVAVRACQVTASGWKEGEAIAIDTAPAYDAGACVEGVRRPEGFWLFDLTTFADRTDDRGFALVPGEAGGVDYQVAFKAS